MDGPSEHHKSLGRQLRRLGLSPHEPPDAARWAALLEQVSASYREADAERYTLERSITISSEEMRALHDVLSHQARHDALTGLPNRAALVGALAGALTGPHRDGRTTAVLFLDLDGFKRVNDVLGHAAGDELLVQASERICSAVRAGDVVSRIGGDEFVVLCADVEDVDAVTAVARRIVARFDAPFGVGGRDVAVGVSVGVAVAVAVAVAGAGAVSGEDLLHRADTAMYRAKTSGGARFVVLDDESLRGGTPVPA